MRTNWKNQAAEYLQGWQRTQADFVNYKKRTEEEKKQLVNFAEANLVSQLLPVLDNFQRATTQIPSESTDNPAIQQWIIGIQSIEKQLWSIMSNTGLKRITVNPGDKFDPHLHEAMIGETSDQAEDTIIAELAAGYTFHDQVIRPVKVKVSR